jgi:hypothetical protein
LQESNAESALDALKELQSENAKTLRDGKMARLSLLFVPLATRQLTQRACAPDLGAARARSRARRRGGAARGRQGARRAGVPRRAAHALNAQT